VSGSVIKPTDFSTVAVSSYFDDVPGESCVPREQMGGDYMESGQDFQVAGKRSIARKPS
jgi:hypothetical protein